MKIRTQFMISTLVLGSFLLLVSVSEIITGIWIQQLNGQEELAAQIERQAYELGYLANDYLLYREGQQASRWEVKFASFSHDLSNMEVNTPEQQALLANIKTNQQRLKAVFAEVRASIENAPQTQEPGFDAKFMQVSWSRLEVQNQGLIFDASRLGRMLRDQEVQLRRVTSLFSFVLIGVFGAFLLGTYALTFRRTLRSIAELQSGTRIIGSGDLDFAIAVKNEDEIGELARAFNQMTADLKEVTASKADLEREIAERQQAQEALRLSEKKFALAFANNPAAIALTRLDDGIYQDVNDTWLELTGYNRKEVIGFSARKLPIWPTTKAAARFVQELREKGALRWHEQEFRKKSGEVFVAQLSAQLLPIQNELMILSTLVDITERKQAEEALRRNEALLLETGKMAKVGGWELDLQTMRPVWTLETYRIHEVDPSLQPELEGAINFYAPEARLQITEAVRRAIEEGQPYDLELPLITATRRNIWIRTIGQPEFRDGNCVRLFGTFQDITERRQAEETLRHNEALLQAVLDNSPEPIYLKDRNSRLLLANPATLAVIGKPAEAVLGKTDAEFYDDPATGCAIMENDRRIMNSGQIEIVEESVSDSRGTRVYLSTKAPYRDVDGQIIGLIGVARDITERKRAEAELVRLASFPERNPNPIVELEYSGDIVYLNPKTQELFADLASSGLKHPILIGLEPLMPNFKAGELEKHIIQEVKAGEAYYHQTIVNIPESGRIRLYNVDITGRKQAEEALLAAMLEKQTAQYARTLIEVSLDPMVTISPEGRITDVNEATVKATGVPREELVGTDFSSYFTEPGEAEQGYRQVFGQGFATDYPLTLRHRDGHLMDVLYNASLYKDTHGSVLGVFAAARDVTAQKQAEAELRRHKDNLEILVKERTSALEESNRMLARSNENLEQFAYVASHDLQEPLRIMASYSQLLQKRYQGRLDGKADEFIYFIVDAAARMQNLIADLLAYSRAGRETADLAEVDCNHVLHRLVSGMAVTIKSVDGCVTFDHLPSITARESSLVQLFQNLIGNALKFRGEQPPRIHVSAEQVGGEWVFSVCDNGIGIEPQYAQRIFMIFQRLHARNKYPGTGIGLSICQKIVENLGGRIWVESEPGQGSTFFFTVPIQ